MSGVALAIRQTFVVYPPTGSRSRLERQCDSLCRPTSGFVDGVMFAHEAQVVCLKRFTIGQHIFGRTIRRMLSDLPGTTWGRSLMFCFVAVGGRLAPAATWIFVRIVEIAV